MKILPVAKFIAVGIVLLFVVAKGCSYFDEYWYEGFLPDSVEVDKALYVASSGGFGEGCGVAIYKIDAKTSERIRAKGIAAVQSSRKAKRHENRLYSEWKETPYVEPEPEGLLRSRWLSGLAQGCSDIPDDMNAAIYNAMKTPGSFYATALESGVIIFPKLGWIMFSHFG
ncbi:hypothetical protein EDC30_1262 [Paucimonas lemoignei]|uniref:Uncharacterized protein n=1 Tax=Paucimonas lemoignei TaxID=29443 RepID=A0A4R3HP65_PAULE|nr:hypothetical protein [Paucimonas lemoignei]TCS31964.1 hypothetical protein EDC30_1262 [Paucimonas lemoignei]